MNSCKAWTAIALFLIAAATHAQSPISGRVTWPIAAGGNGNAYQVFTTGSGMPWSYAAGYAASIGGHLATLTSAAENTFVYNLTALYPSVWLAAPPNGTYGPWLGGYKVGALWQWVTGEAFTYQNWYPGEPNNGCIGQYEDKLEFSGGLGGSSPMWNDLPDVGCQFIPTPNGFVVEFENPIFPTISPVPTPIPDGLGGCLAGPPVTFFIPVSGVAAATNVALNLTMAPAHTWFSDLSVTLTSPSGNSTVLMISDCQGAAGAPADLAGPYTLRDDAAVTLAGTAAATSPLVAIPAGIYRPANSMNQLLACGANGMWSVTFQDYFIGDTGAVSALSLSFDSGPAPAPGESFTICQSGPGAPIVLVHTGGEPGGYYLNPVTLNTPTSIPGGWFFGLDVPISLLLFELTLSPLVVGTLDLAGASYVAIPPLPPGFTIQIVGVHFAAATQLPTFSSIPISYVVL